MSQEHPYFNKRKNLIINMSIYLFSFDIFQRKARKKELSN